MSPKEAARILDLLAQGLDPDSGELLAQDSVLNSPEVIRALFLATRALGSLSSEQVPQKPKDPNLPYSGTAWTQEETERLLACFDTGVSMEQLARLHGRTKGGIAARLVKLGRIDERSDVYRSESRHRSGTDRT